MLIRRMDTMHASDHVVDVDARGMEGGMGPGGVATDQRAGR
jgi:hypothetical protein